VSAGAFVSWFVLVSVFSLIATWIPARRAAALSVKEAMVQL